VSRPDQPGWQTRLAEQLRQLPGVEVFETPESQLPQPVDVFIDPGEGAPAPLTTHYPRLGVWRFVYGPEGRLTEPCSHEHAEGRRGVMVRLVSIAADGTATVLECGVMKSVTHSLGATRARVFDTIWAWPARAMRQVVRNADYGVRGPRVSIQVGASAPPQPAAGRTLRNLAARIAREAIEEHWAVGVIRKPVHHVIDSFDPHAIEWLPAPVNGALADPAGAIERDGTLTILAEAYDFEDRQGRIVALDVRDQRIVSGPREVLRLQVHASYPHLIQHGGEIYCLPEASATGRVQLFRADPFPDRWVPDRILLQSFAGADATLHRHGGRWWMFTGDQRDQDEAKLNVFHADDLFGPWHAHARNPVKCDLRSARSAGPLFEHDGQLYRPAQDGSLAYGGAVAVNRILTLSPEDFAEETVNVLRPAPRGPFPHGLHTLAGVGNITLVDGKRHARSFKKLAWGLKQLVHAHRVHQPAA